MLNICELDHISKLGLINNLDLIIRPWVNQMTLTLSVDLIS